MKALQVFENEEFGKVRTVDIDGKPYFVGVDVARALGYVDSSHAVINHCKGTVKVAIPSKGGEQETNVIPEGDVYRLIVKSQLPSADKFEHWVFDDVLPSIRKHGMYATDELVNNPDLLIQVATKLKEEREARILAEKKIELDAPKVQFFNQVADSADAKDMRDVAAAINMPGWGRNRIFRFLRENGILDKENLPYREFQDRGYFRVIEQKWTDKEGETHISLKTLVYQKGVDYIIKLIRRREAIPA